MLSIWSESTTRPNLAISGFEASRISSASFWRSRMRSSTVIEPTMERRWPANIRPVRRGIWSSSARKRRAALTIEAVSSPTLKAITALTISVIPCWVTHGSWTSASCIERERKDTLERRGLTNFPCPVTIRNGVPSSPRALAPLTIMASSGSGMRYPNIVCSFCGVTRRLSRSCQR